MKHAVFLILALAGAIGGASAAGTPASTDEAEQWGYAVDTEDTDRLRSFLERFPQSVHAEQARALLLKHVLRPLGKLVAGGPQCATFVEDRANEQMRYKVGKPKYVGYDFTVPPGYFVNHSSIEFRPNNKAPEQVHVEDVIAMDLVAGRDGSCAVYERWNIGIGLPEECRCVPVDASYVFESDLARKVLTGYSQLKGANSVCAAKGEDHDKDIEDWLDGWIAGKTRWAQAIRTRQQRKQTVYPSEAGDADDVEFAMPKVRERKLNQEAFDAVRRAVSSKTPEQLAPFCRNALPHLIEQGDLRTLLSTIPPG